MRVTNLSGFDLRAPLMLVLDPARYFAGTPVGMGIGSGGLWLLDIGAALPNGVLAPGASTTVRTVTLNNPRGQHIELGSGVYALPYPNSSPVFDGPPPPAATAGQAWTWQPLALDPDGAVVTYVLLTAPAGMAFDPATGALSWLPTAASPAQSSVVLRAYDTRGGFATRAFAIDVAGGNRAPSLDLPPTVRLVEGQPFALPMIAADPEGTLLSYAVDLLPPGARFDPVRQLLEWTPASDQAGTYRGVRFTVTDSTNTTVRIVDFIVDPVNAAPVLRGIPDRIVRQGDPVRFTVVADDADGDPVAYALASPLRGGSIDPTTGVFSWTPPYDLAGSFDLVFRATDGRTTGERKVRLTVVNANVAPVFDPVENLSVLEGEALTLRLFAFDADNPHFIRQIRLDDGALAPLEGTPPTVTYGSGALPAGATFD